MAFLLKALFSLYSMGISSLKRCNDSIIEEIQIFESKSTPLQVFSMCGRKGDIKIMTECYNAQ